jgi:hypothetical protein
MKIRSTDFVGNSNMTLSKGNCSYTIVNTGGETRSINASATVSSSTQKMQAIISKINPKIIISSWQNLADF